MFPKLNDVTCRAAAAIQARRNGLNRSRGLETVEWVLVGVALVIVAFVAYQYLGGRMNTWIRELGDDIN